MASSKDFSKSWLESQKKLLLKLKEDVVNRLKEMGTEDLKVDTDQVIEDGDQAQTYLDQNVNFGLRERELSRLREIEAALHRIEDGSYGYCEETDEPIGKKRLEKMPWTRLSIQAAEQEEREAQRFHKIG